jgi:hypothetical protein
LVPGLRLEKRANDLFIAVADVRGPAVRGSSCSRGMCAAFRK